MGLGQRIIPQPLTAIGEGFLGGLEQAKQEQALKAQSLRKQMEADREFKLKQDELGLKKGEFDITKRKEDIQILGELNKRINVLAQENPDEANKLIQNFRNSTEGQRILKENNLDNIDLQILATGEKVLSGEYIVDDNNKKFLESTGEQINGIPMKLENGDKVSFKRSPDQKSFNVDKLQKYDEALKILEIKKKSQELDNSINQSFDIDQQKIIYDVLNTLKKESGFTKTTEALSAATNAKVLVNLKNPITDAALPVTINRLVGEVGNLTKNEQDRFGGSKAIVSKLEQFYEKLKTGKFTDENREYLKGLIDVYETNARNRLTSIINASKSDLEQISDIKGDKINKVFDNLINSYVITTPINWETKEEIKFDSQKVANKISQLEKKLGRKLNEAEKKFAINKGYSNE